jgi:hypothetical protein
MNASQWPSWTDEVCWEPSDDDERWNAEQNEDWHDLDDDDDTAEADPWTEGDQWEADGWFDDRAAESAYLDAHEQGLKTF